MTGQTSRRNVFALAAASAAGLPGAAGQSAGRRPPNVLLLLSDQHQPRALGIDGHPVVKTPNLDALARSGVRFQRAYCANPVCGPARASIWTGLYTHHHRVWTNEVPWPVGTKSIAHSFRAAGYHTAAIGKMHFASAHTHGFDYRLDFNDWYQYLGPKVKIYADEVGWPFPGDGHPQIRSLWRDTGDPWKDVYENDGRKGRTHLGRVSKLAEEDHFDSFVARESIEYLKTHARQGPFFLVTSFLKPHQPFMPAARFAALYRAGEMRLPESWGKKDPATTPRFIQQRMAEHPITPEVLDPRQALQRIASYYGCLTQMDDCVGVMLRALKELGLEDDTIVVYTSDHGELLGEHSLWQKFVFYEASVGAPLIFRVPGMTRAGAACEALASHVQLAPTLAELCGVNSLAAYDGASLVPWLKDPRRPSEAPVHAHFDLRSPNKKAMVRHGDWKYCHYGNDIPELFNLREDPLELRNLAAVPAARGKLEELRSMIIGLEG